MANPKPLYDRVTLVDVQLAAAYYPILVDLARHKHCLTYSELLARAKKTYPERPVVQKAIAVSTGRRLDVVRMFTSERDLPDLSALIISKTTGECGSGFTRSFNPVAARVMVFGFDWSEVSTDFDGFVNHAEKAIKPRKKTTETAALSLMHQYFQSHKSTLPASIREQRELIVELIMAGFAPSYAFEQGSLLCKANPLEGLFDGNEGR